MDTKRVYVKVEGIVQGVGFRPYVYSLANSNNLKGWVNNSSEGVFIDVEGADASIENFLYNLKTNPPPLARIESITVSKKLPCGYQVFLIKESERNEDKITLISPDIAVCKECLEDTLTPHSRRYFYPFTNCTNCGPRYSIIKQIPYDRDKTTMNNFEMCQECKKEYANPLNRRFHAQPNACHTCGPHIYLTDNKGTRLEFSENPTCHVNATQKIISFTQEKLKEGFIFAIKGLTGFHLVCDGENASAIELLRKRKNRPHKPFAVMMKDIETVKNYCMVSDKEEELLCGIRKPILLLNKLNNCDLPEMIAPNQNTLGVMLPFTPLHELLFLDKTKVLLMTSANAHGLPLEYINDNAVEHLSDLVDYFLMHNRDIYMPVDDSVSRVLLDRERVIRRGRGYAPEPINFKSAFPILACGSNMKNTACITKDDFLFLSPHNGDLENLETYEHYKRNIEHFRKIFAFEPKYIAADMHPEYFSTQYAHSCDVPVINVQHHHAHIVSCMVENKLPNSKVIGIAFDGTGYGTDGKIWGGEFLICNYSEFNRAAHLDYISMPGGEKAISEPWRMAVSYLHKSLPEDTDYILNNFGREASIILKMIDRNINCIETSSMGRLFDAVSAILNICCEVSYEGQASIELETVITGSDDNFYAFNIQDNKDEFIIDTTPIIRSILTDKKSGVPNHIISQRFHNTVVAFSIDICKKLRALYNINDIALSGGVFQNSYLYTGLTKTLEKENFKVYSHSMIPTNDGGVALGQIAIANEKIKELQEENK
jgi:hydrogenase maturation protein HypF